MSKEKQIEELAEILQNVCSAKPNKMCLKKLCCQCRAETAIEAGYRKQRTAEWVTTTETEDGVIVRYTHCCTDCNYFYKTVCPRGDDFCHKCGARMGGGAE